VERDGTIMISQLADIYDQITRRVGDTHQLVLAIAAGVAVIVLGAIVQRLIGHILHVLIWVIALGVTVWIVYGHPGLPIDRHQVARLFVEARRLVGG